MVRFTVPDVQLVVARLKRQRCEGANCSGAWFGGGLVRDTHNTRLHDDDSFKIRRCRKDARWAPRMYSE